MLRSWLTSTLACLLAFSLGTGVASADPNKPRGKGVTGGGRANPQRMKKIIEKFDKDADGKLSESKRQAARAALGKFRKPQG